MSPSTGPITTITGTWPSPSPAGSATAGNLVAVLKKLHAEIEALDRRIAELTPKHPEAYLFANLPGAGPVLLPRLIVAFGTHRDRFHSAAELAAYSGIAPVRKQSGNSQTVVFRRARPAVLRQTFHEFAACSRAKSAWAGAFYQAKRQARMRQHAALRALAFKWIRILFRCWKDRTPYDESRYLRSLEQRHSPLVEPGTANGCTKPAKTARRARSAKPADYLR